MSKSSNTLFAFITGAVAGVTIGILFAPDNGKSTRDKLSFKLGKYQVKLQEIIEQLMQEKEMPASLAKSESQKVINDAKTKAEKLLEDVDALIDQIKNKK